MKLPTMRQMETITYGVADNLSHLDDVDELMFYAKNDSSDKIIKIVAKDHKARLAKFRKASAQYIQNMERLISALPTEGK